VLIVSVYTDLAKGKIYNWCTLSAIVVGLLFNYAIGGLADGGWTGANLLSSAAAVLVVFLVFAWPYFRGGIAAGDVKLILAVAAIGGFHKYFAIYALFYSVLIGGLMALLVFVWKGKLVEGLKGAARFAFSTGRAEKGDAGGDAPARLTIPYGFAIAIGSTIAWYLVELPKAGGPLAVLGGP
jgi:prepilin peptidase CpaA